MIKVNFERPFHVTSLDLILFSEKYNTNSKDARRRRMRWNLTLLYFCYQTFTDLYFCHVLSLVRGKYLSMTNLAKNKTLWND
jgi:hypothetical protein